MRNRCADRIHIRVGNEQVGVGARLTERVVTAELGQLAGLPPAVHGGHDRRMQRLVEFRL